MSTTKPVFMRASHDEQRIVHREKVAKLVTPGSGVFTILAALALNPGLQATFPWLSNEAAGWESYRFNRCRAIWVPTSGTQVAGDIIIAPDYDAADAPPASETNMSAYTDAEEANVWARFACDMEQDLLNGESRRKFIRLGALAPNLDIKTYDSGNLFVASTDDAVANTGKLWIEYDVTLFNPHVPPGGFQSSGMLVSSAAGIVALTAPFGTAPVPTGPVALSITANAGQVLVSNVQIGQELSIKVATIGTGITSAQIVSAIGLTAKSTVGTAINAAATEAVTWETKIVSALPCSFTVDTSQTTVTAMTAEVTVLAPQPSL
jgi:hypothetical protein